MSIIFYRVKIKYIVKISEELIRFFYSMIMTAVDFKPCGETKCFLYSMAVLIHIGFPAFKYCLPTIF